MSTQLEEAEFYQHSGRTGYSMPALLILGTPIAMLAAAIYSYVVVYVPVIGYVNIIFLAGYVFALGFSLGFLAKKFKCRSPGQLFLISGVVGLIGVYFAWVFFLKALVGDQIMLFPLMRSPAGVWELVKFVVKEGWWENGPSGIFEWIIISIEAAIMVGGAALVAQTQIANEVFCEDCNTWCEKTGQKNFSIKQCLEQAVESAKSETSTDADSTVTTEPEVHWEMPGHLDILKLPAAEESEVPRIVAEVLTCTGCQQTNAIRYRTFSMTVDSDGNTKEQLELIPGILMRKSEVGPEDDFDA